MPSSRTETTISPPSRRALSWILPRGSVYLAALMRRFEKTCARRTASASSRMASRGNSSDRLWCLASSRGRAVSIAALSTETSSTGAFFSSRDPRDVEQIIEQAAHVGDLPLHDLIRPLPLLRGPLGLAVGRKRIADRRERIAQLVSEQGQE